MTPNASLVVQADQEDCPMQKGASPGAETWQRRLKHSAARFLQNSAGEWVRGRSEWGLGLEHKNSVVRNIGVVT